MSCDSDEDYAEFGTPLEPLDEDVCPRKKPFTIEEQFARDKHGRRRFHGAFTGGFSAGFLNTVGSLEGWKPSSFKSSRSEKAEKILQKPEHFMDEEDTGEFGIAPSVLQAKDHFSSSTSSTKRKYQQPSDGSAFGISFLKNLLQPVRETVGIRLLKNMGWKPGQGVGPRVSKHEKQKISKLRKKVYGCSVAPDSLGTKSDKVECSNDDDEDDGDDDSHDDDVDNDNDVEWEDLTFAPDDCLPFSITPKENVFGIGYKGLDKVSILSVPQLKSDLHVASNKAIRGQAFGVGAFEEEDEDIYSREDMSQYDFSLGDPTKGEELTTSYVSREELYDDFVPSVKRSVKKTFPPPFLPKNFTGIHKASRFEPVPLPEPSKKLNDSPERENLAEDPEEIQRKARQITSSISGSAKAQTSCKPFAADVDKQRRYEKYLELDAAGKKDELRELQPITMTEWEKEREKIEFQQAARLFSPLNMVADSRFTTASQPDDLHDPLATVEKLKSGSEDEQKAAKMNMFGELTRKIEPWKPSSLLCKRFNIRELNVNEIPIVNKKSKPSIFDNFDALKPQVAEQKEDVAPKPTLDLPEVSIDEKLSEAKEGDKTVQIDFPDAKNKLDLFNAIFLDTDSEEEDEGTKTPEARTNAVGSKGRDDTPPPPQNSADYEEQIINDKRNTSPARGIFENLDSSLLRLVDKKSEKAVPERREESRDGKVDEKADEMESDLMYGPKLPDKITAKTGRLYYEPTMSNDDCWVEKTEHKKEKRNSKKYKKSKHKHKKSKKRKK